MREYNEFIDYISDFEIPVVKDNKKIQYLNIECGFDIETTSITQDGEKIAFMYVWQIGLGYGNDVFFGRTWESFYETCLNLQEHFSLNVNRRLVIYVHNLGYEFQFMRKYFEWIDVFSNTERKPIRALCDLGIEFRDSYILSGYSLDTLAKNLTKNKVKKLVGNLDYSLIRHHETELTDDEIAYCVNDVQIILAYINEQITYCKDISLIPMTNTGRVRKYVRNNCYYIKTDGSKAGKGQYVRYRNIMQDLTLDKQTYLQLKKAFMGGFTHANSKYSGQVLENVTSIDFTSSYPSVMLAEKFPMSRFKNIDIHTVKELKAYCEKYAIIFDGLFTGVQSLIDENYLSESKCDELMNPIINNGRVVSADSLQITLTDIDFAIMEQCYTWDSISVKNVRYAHKNYLPKPIIHSVLKLYQDKTQLKDVQGMEVEYLLSKGMLNSVYGMCVTDVVKEKVTYGNEWGVEIPSIVDEIVSYNESRNRFLYYAWGVWITAFARRNLWTGILATGDDYIYSDTDSLKIINYKNHLKYVEWFNDDIVKKMKTMCKYYGFNTSLLSPKTKEGKIKTIGIWDYEGTYTRFKTLGAKRYLIQDGEKMQLTVAGLSKQNGLNYMLEVCDNDKLKVFDMFNDDLYIPSDRTGKMTHTYIDCEYQINVTDYRGKSCEVKTLSSVHLESCEFTLSVSHEYKTFLKNLSKGYIYKGVKNK